MNPERWQQVKEILDGALQKDPAERSAFVGQACFTDPSLKREVESLLASRSGVEEDFLKSEPPDHVWIANGTRFGSYEILGLIGAGGMGEVYRARDQVLGREVAIKMLPSAIALDREHLRRFEQEARAAAALNHPNIFAIYQMGTNEGAPYLVMELLSGSALREQLMKGPLQTRTAVDYSVQIARGLSAAHEKGIVHRDLKPENLFVTKDGRVKILDFGLAKLTQKQSRFDPSAPTIGTESGMLMGTVGYMSPEQVRGQPADHRADIFALGAILYEALTGQRAFRKPSSVETMGAILNEDPLGVSVLAPTVPLGLRKIVQRCLEKDPDRRFQSASDLAFALEALTDSGVQSAPGPTQPRRLSRWWYAGIGVTGLLVAALVFVVLRQRSSVVPTSAWVQITNFTDSVTQPSFSPDGRMVTFLRGSDSFTSAGQVYVMLLPHGNPVRLTNDSMAKMGPVFSPDAASIAYTVPWDTWTVPVLGGQAQLWLANASGLTWPDADSLMFSQITSGNHMEAVRSDLSRAHVQPIYTPESSIGMVHRSYLSPNRKWVIAVEMTGNLWERCRLVPFDGSTPGAPIGPPDGVCTAAAWSPDGKWMYLDVSSGQAFHIWRQKFPNGGIEQVTSGPTEEEGIALDPDGRFLITSVGIHRTGVWLHDSHGERLLTSEANAGLANPRNGSPFSPDGKKLYYLVRRTPGREVRPDIGIGELWELDLQSGATRAAMPGFTITDFSLSPDGRDIAFSALTDDSIQSIWVAPLDRGSSPRVLQSSAYFPRFTSSFIYYEKRTPAGTYVHRIRPDGSGDEQVWHEKIMALATSPDGRYLAVTLPLEGRSEWKLEIVDWARKRVQPVCNDAIAYWSDDGRSFIATGGTGKRNTSGLAYISSLPVANGLPELPANGLANVSQFGGLPGVRTVASGIIGPGRTPDTYAFVRDTVQRNLYRIPLR